MLTEVCSAGFPHSDISGSMDICSSPKLFAAYHVFLRLLVPRHPPCALSSLTRFLCPRVRSDSLAHSVAPLVGSFFFTHLSVCLGCLSSILIFKILDLFQYAVFKVRCKNKICSAAQKACFLKRLTNFIFIACLHASEETQFPNCSVHSAIYLPPAPIWSRSASGDGEIRTLDPLLARQVLSQLSYTPTDAGHPLSRLPLFVFSIFIYIQLRRSTMPSGNGLKWTRTTDLTLIRRAL